MNYGLFKPYQKRGKGKIYFEMLSLSSEVGSNE
jgi:hypothetical protein